MANFNNTVAPGFSAAQVQQVMTTNGAQRVANFFRETSYGQQLMNVTATPGWVTLNMAQPTTCSTTDWRNIGTSAEAAQALGSAYDPAAYNFVVYVFPGVSSCGWSGLAYIGVHKAWINGTGSFSTATIAHEMGHNFGLLHAASLRCTTAIGGACSSSEYGDPFDAMGNQRAMHYNAMQKAKLAWIPSTSVKTHAGGSATYTLSPLETGGATTYAVKIPTAASNRTYWLEFRQPIGFDSPLAAFNSNGAQIRVSYPFETMCSGRVHRSVLIFAAASRSITWRGTGYVTAKHSRFRKYGTGSSRSTTSVEGSSARTPTTSGPLTAAPSVWPFQALPFNTLINFSRAGTRAASSPPTSTNTPSSSGARRSRSMGASGSISLRSSELRSARVRPTYSGNNSIVSSYGATPSISRRRRATRRSSIPGQWHECGARRHRRGRHRVLDERSGVHAIDDHR